MEEGRVLEQAPAPEAAGRLAQVTVLVIAFNSAAVLPGCLAALPRGVRLVVVDNASTDDSAAIAEAAGAEVIRLPGNLGFGRAANLGFARAETPFGLLLNPDTRAAPGMVEALLEAAARYPEAALLAPRIETEEGELQFGRLPVLLRHRGRARPVPPVGDCCAPYVGGAAMFFRLEVFRALGGFDPEIFLYYEDDDICMRLRAAGHALVHVEAARLLHGNARSSAPSAAVSFGKEWHMAWSRQHMLRKHRGAWRAAAAGGLLMAELAGKLALRWGHPQRGKWSARLAGTAAAMAGRRAVEVAIR
nr:glycosyltransferase family 2 protein [Siccirubricoccus soli]